jgi:hypothetical protein
VWRHIKNSVYVVFLLTFATSLFVSSSAFAATKVQTSICGDFLKPTILSPITDFKTQDASVLVSGNAQPFLSVAVTVDGAVNGITTAASDGTYALQVSVHVGDNTIAASDANGCGVMKESDSIVVHRDEVEQTQVESSPVAINPQVSAQPNLATVIPRALGQPLVVSPSTPGLAEPIIKQPTAGEIYTSSRVWVVGTATPGSIVTVYLNDVSVAKVSASARGEFAAMIELHAGSNTLQVRSERDDLFAVSKKITASFMEANPTTPSPSIGTVLMVAAVTTTTVAVGVGGVTWTVRRIRLRFK